MSDEVWLVVRDDKFSLVPASESHGKYPAVWGSIYASGRYIQFNVDSDAYETLETEAFKWVEKYAKRNGVEFNPDTVDFETHEVLGYKPVADIGNFTVYHRFRTFVPYEYLVTLHLNREANHEEPNEFIWMSAQDFLDFYKRVLRSIDSTNLIVTALQNIQNRLGELVEVAAGPWPHIIAEKLSPSLSADEVNAAVWGRKGRKEKRDEQKTEQDWKAALKGEDR